eukprot:5823423-Karenia_brevis.AAC.1
MAPEEAADPQQTPADRPVVDRPSHYRDPARANGTPNSQGTNLNAVSLESDVFDNRLMPASTLPALHTERVTRR